MSKLSVKAHGNKGHARDRHLQVGFGKGERSVGAQPGEQHGVGSSTGWGAGWGGE